MRVESELYKGIEYVRVSNLPDDQKEKIKTSLPKDKVIKILMDGSLIEDCIQYADYLTWFEAHHQGVMITSSRAQSVSAAFKFSIK
ncbi:MAG: hypothetical protein ABL895_03310 [Cyclobacteriaceae bacterium]